MSPKYMTAGMGDAGPCHPRDNIALRYLAERLDLGYDLFDTVMHARERQAENIASFLTDLQKKHDMPIVIHGKAYKPDVDMLEGSYSLLIGSYLEEQQAHFIYCDPLTGDTIPDESDLTGIVFLAHNRQITYGYTGELPQQQLYFSPGHGSIIVDPWRRYTTRNPSYKVIHYGNTRSRD
jgi:UDPglucose 6-dehydrogenase